MNLNTTLLTTFFPHRSEGRKVRGKGLSALGKTALITFGLGLAQFSHAETSTQTQTRHAIDRFLTQSVKNEAQRHQWQGIRFENKVMLSNIKDLPACKKALQVNNPSSLRSGRLRLQVTCPTPQGWQRTVKSELALWLPVLVTSQLLERGQTISHEHLTEKEVDVQKLHRGYYQSADQLIGHTAKRRIRNGQVLAPSLIDHPILVRRGEHLEVVAKNAFFQVIISAEAIENGSLDEVIRVRNLSSGKTFEAQVKGPRLAESTL